MARHKSAAATVTTAGIARHDEKAPVGYQWLIPRGELFAGGFLSRAWHARERCCSLARSLSSVSLRLKRTRRVGRDKVLSLQSRNGEYRQTIFKDIYASRLGKRGGVEGCQTRRRRNARMFKPCTRFYTSCESFIALGSPKYRGHAKLSISYIFNNTGHGKEKLIKLRLDKVLSDTDTR